MRRWLSALLASLVLANLVAWPSAALAEVLEHDLEVTQNGEETLPVEPAPVHCPHGCIGHYSQHFQWQAPAPSFQAASVGSAEVTGSDDSPRPQYIPASPFRPPLGALIWS